MNVAGGRVAADDLVIRVDIAGDQRLAQAMQRFLVQPREQRKLPHQIGFLHGKVQRRAVIGPFAPCGHILHKCHMQFRADQPVGAHRVIFALFQTQGRATDEAALQFLGITGILQAHPVQTLLDLLQPPVQQVVEQIGDAAAMDAADAGVDETVQIAQDQALGQQDLEAVCGAAAQRARQAQAVVQKDGGAEPRPVAQTAPCRALIPGAPAAAGGFDQPVRIAEDAIRQTRGNRAFAKARKDHLALGPGQRDQAQCHTVLVRDFLAFLGILHGLVQPRGKALGLGPYGFAGQLVTLGGGRHILAHLLQGDGDDLLRQGRIQRRQPVQPQPFDHPAQGGALHQKREQREARGKDADHALDLDRHAEALGHSQRQRQRHRAAQPAPEDRDPVGAFDHGRQADQRQKGHQAEQDDHPRCDGRKDHHDDQRQIRQAHLVQQARDQQGGKDKDQRPRPMGQQPPDLAQVRPASRWQAPRPQQVQRQAGRDRRDHT